MVKLTLGPDETSSNTPTINATEVHISAQSSQLFHFLIALKKLGGRVAILGFPRGRVTPVTDIVIDWFTHVSQTKYADIMTEDLDKEL
jgi:hypothetical protein